MYQLVVTEVLLQQTKAETVASFYGGFFEAYPNWHSLANANPKELQVVLRPLGLWRRRAVRLIEFAKSVHQIGDELPSSREGLEQLPSVGQYVANAALLFQGVSNEPLLDSGMARVLERFFGPRKLADIRYDPYLQTLAREVVDCGNAIDVNWGILDLSSSLCRRTAPRCSECPVAEVCRYCLRGGRGGID